MGAGGVVVAGGLSGSESSGGDHGNGRGTKAWAVDDHGVTPSSLMTAPNDQVQANTATSTARYVPTFAIEFMSPLSTIDTRVVGTAGYRSRIR
jgi:hypothetical protein